MAATAVVATFSRRNTTESLAYPSEWGAFLQQMKEQPTELDSDLGIFGARYRLAREFTRLELGKIAADTASYYSVITKIGLAYACLERLERILGDGSHSEIKAPDLASKLRNVRYSSLIDLAVEHTTSEKLKARIQELRTDECFDDVRPFIEAIRHSLFHGRFTPGTSGQRVSKNLLELLDGLAHVTLRHADQTFTVAIGLRRNTDLSERHFHKRP